MMGPAFNDIARDCRNSAGRGGGPLSLAPYLLADQVSLDRLVLAVMVMIYANKE